MSSLSSTRLDLDSNPIKPITICIIIGTGGFIGSHLCEKFMFQTPPKVLALDVYNDKLKHLLELETLPWNNRIESPRLNIKRDSKLEGLIKIADLVIKKARCISQHVIDEHVIDDLQKRIQLLQKALWQYNEYLHLLKDDRIQNMEEDMLVINKHGMMLTNTSDALNKAMNIIMKLS